MYNRNNMKNKFLILFCLIASIAFAQNNSFRVIDLTGKVNYGHRKTEGRTIDIIVIHSSYYANSKDTFSLDGVMKQYKEYGVSPHYIIDRKGVVYRTVADKDVAFHAGNSRLPKTKRSQLNTNSIGIEIINTPKHPPTEEQYLSLAVLVERLKSTYPIEYIVRHSDISPGRKTDPWAFDWNKFLEMIN